MEIVQLVGRNSQGLYQRVFIELVRRKIAVEIAFMGNKESRVIMILGISNLPGKEKTLHALKAIPDVISAEYLSERVKANWEAIPQDGFSFEILRDGKDSDLVTF